MDDVEVDIDQFQADTDFDPTDGADEPDDWDDLVSEAPAVVLGGGGTVNSAAVNRMVGIARGQRGVVESPVGSNRGVPHNRYVKCFGSGLPPSPWCCFFVSWAWDQASDKNHKVSWSNPGYLPTVRDWAKEDRPARFLAGTRGRVWGWRGPHRDRGWLESRHPHDLHR